MWKIQKPYRQKAMADIDVFRERNIIDENDVVKLETLTNQYDSQDGMVTDEQHNNISDEGALSLKNHYPDTYSTKPLAYIRSEVFDGIYKCPYCSIGVPEQLDHYMPKSQYPALALCRLNLVPLCGSCNVLKSDNWYSDFIHPYYQGFPTDTIFLKGHLRIEDDALLFNFTFDENVLDSELHQRLTIQWTHLKLDERLTCSVIWFLHDEILYDCKDKRVFIEYIKHKSEDCVRKYGLNDWRSAIVRCIRDEMDCGRANEIMNAINRMYSRQKDIKT